MRIFFTLLVISLCSYSGLSIAAPACSIVNAAYYFKIPVTVYPDTPAGTELGAQTISGNLFTCSYTDREGNNKIHNITIHTGRVPWDQSIDGVPIYPTSVSDIGYSLGLYIPNCNKTDITWQGAASDGTACSKSSMIGRTIPGQLTLRLYKKNQNITVGTEGTSSILGWVTTYINGEKQADMSSYLSKFTVTKASCMVINRNIEVNLDPISKFKFSGVGSSPSQGSKTFNISVKCLENTAVKLQIDGSNIYSASQGVLSEASGNNIGVGIQVRYNDNPVTFGSPFSVGTAGPTLDIPLEARYYQTDAKIQPGIVSAFATFTMTYN